MDDCYQPMPFKVPMPEDFDDETLASLPERADALCSAAEAIAVACAATNQPLPTPTKAQREIAEATFFHPSAVNLTATQSTAAAMMLTALLREYDMAIVENAQQVRNFVTNNLIEMAANAKTEASRLKANELLGKIKDVGLFEERTHVTVENMTTEQIQSKLREKLLRLREVPGAATTVPFREA